MKKLASHAGILLFLLLLSRSGAASQDLARFAMPRWATRAVHAPRLQYHTFYSKTAKAKVSYHIYVPPDYDTEKDRRFPVLYRLHGAGGGLKGLQPLVKLFDEAIRSKKIPPMLIVFPNGGRVSMWCDSKDGRIPVETVVVKELIPQVDSLFRTIASREGRMIEGFSMGGYGAGRLAFKYPGLFAAVSMLGPGPLQLDFLAIGPRSNRRARRRVLQAIYGGDLEYFKAQSPWVLAEQNADALRGNMLIRLVIGEKDEMLSIVRDFSSHLRRLNLAHEFIVVPNVGHNPPALLTALGEANWSFYRKAFSF